jgi:hypothetical protein
MNLTSTRPALQNPLKVFSGVRVRTSFVYGLIIIVAMAAFEVFNYATTAFALKDLLGDLAFAGISWATFLALAFCGIDFAGIASLITQPHQRENKDAWYLFGAWLIAGTANAALTWWGVTMAITNHSLGSSAVISTSTLVKVVPIFVAVMVWVIRVLIISSLSTALERMSTSRRMPMHSVNPQARASYSTNRVPVQPAAMRSAPTTHSPVVSRTPMPSQVQRQRVEPTYHPLSASAHNVNHTDQSQRRM